MKFSRSVTYCLGFVGLLSLVSMLLAPTSQAQGIPSTTGIVLSASAENPAPGQTVTITAASYVFDISAATVTWTINGKLIQKGIGLTTYTTVAPALGKKTAIDVLATTVDGARSVNSITIGSGYIDLIMETDGYVPPFFKGKIPFSYQNTFTVTAIPHLVTGAGKEADPTTLIYQWKKDDGTVLQSQSGYGKQSISITGDIVPRPYYLIVNVSTRDGSGQAQGLILINPISPSISFYLNDPLYGPLFNTVLGSTFHIGAQKEAGVFASLYGFNFSNNITDDLTLDWLINGVEHAELASNRSVTLRAPVGASGTSHVELDVRGVNNILQGSENSFNISFDSSSSNQSNSPVTF